MNMQHCLAVFIALGLLIQVRAGEPASEGQILFQNVCAQCHGPKGEGNPQIKSPSIASLPEWYVKAQIENFRADRRGFHPLDVEGQLMRAITKVLQPPQVAAVSDYVSKMTRVVPERTVKADIALGKELFIDRCMECHRYNGEGELVFGAAPLVGLQDWYLAGELKKFKSGMRGALKEDANGQKMVFSSQFVENEQLLNSVVAYLMTLQEAKPEVIFGK